MICESLLNKKLSIFDSRIMVDSRINLESNHFKKRFESTFSLRFSKKLATRFESRIIDLDSRQALVKVGFTDSLALPRCFFSKQGEGHHGIP